MALFDAPSATAASTSSSRRVSRARPAPLALNKSSARGASWSNVARRWGVEPGGDGLDGCDDFIMARRAIEDGLCARAKHANGVLAVRPVEQNHQSYPIMSGAILGQKLLFGTSARRTSTRSRVTSSRRAD